MTQGKNYIYIFFDQFLMRWEQQNFNSALLLKFLAQNKVTKFCYAQTRLGEYYYFRIIPSWFWAVHFYLYPIQRYIMPWSAFWGAKKKVLKYFEQVIIDWSRAGEKAKGGESKIKADKWNKRKRGKQGCWCSLCCVSSILQGCIRALLCDAFLFGPNTAPHLYKFI